MNYLLVNKYANKDYTGLLMHDLSLATDGSNLLHIDGGDGVAGPANLHLPHLLPLLPLIRPGKDLIPLIIII